MAGSEIGYKLVVAPFEGDVISTGLSTKEGFASWYPFRFYRVGVPKKPLPSVIAPKGTRTKRYAIWLMQLEEAGNRSAKVALDVLTQECQSTGRSRKLRAEEAGRPATPVDLDNGARWPADDAARYALELLLWIWHMRQSPEVCGFLGRFSARLPDFDSDTAAEWWELACFILKDVYRSMQLCPELKALVTTPRKLKSGPSCRDPIIRIIRKRFHKLAPPPAAYR